MITFKQSCASKVDKIKLMQQGVEGLANFDDIAGVNYEDILMNIDIAARHLEDAESRLTRALGLTEVKVHD